MNKKVTKIALISMSLLALSTSVGTVATQQTQPVQATTWYVHHYPYFVTHKVRLTKNVTFQKIYLANKTYEDRVVGTKYLKKGSIIKVRKGGATFPWFVSGHGMTNTKYHGWTVLHQKNWFTTNLKAKPARKKIKATNSSDPTYETYLKSPEYKKFKQVTSKYFFKSEISKGAALNIPNVGVLRLQEIDHLGGQLDLRAYFINFSDKTVDLDQFINEHLHFVDKSHPQVITFHTDKKCPPYADVHFNAYGNKTTVANNFEDDFISIYARKNSQDVAYSLGYGTMMVE